MTSKNIISRYAPTPSGFLHIGNAFNFLLIQKITKLNNGTVKLRIDDLDSLRTRDEYLIDIFESLEWLDLDYQDGPSGLDDFKNNYSQANKKDSYKQSLNKLSKLFVCECSRSMIKKLSAEGIYSGTCRDKKLKFIPRENNIRVEYNSKNNMKDFVVWRKDDIPSYQLASLVDDLSLEVNYIIRGVDLIDSTKAQLHLANMIDPTFLTETRFLHHPLLSSPDGSKLSKSSGAQSLMELRKKEKSANFIIDQFETWYEEVKSSFLES
ncbi:MAG: hypothetical protein KC493_17945 [Bacteriovoracaceae bacterium]|nr:hypothetical protein [Bacteriovoracaceae bacterium]